ncbi:hypothetical protein AVEN_127454-1 [Araneus ventricosus]|uniref:Uncharacterized protein n=1 Tax=Araneus ventricosus TaxID=182803 RepID=A0A4Y2P9V7_ARAVE|nr:hypothetical protein AVEN_127454-1 [Araneus ventricosus]
MVWRHSIPVNISAYPFVKVIYDRFSQTHRMWSLRFLTAATSVTAFKARPYAYSDLNYSERASNPFPDVSIPVAFQHLWPGNPSERLEIQSLTTMLQFS